MFSRRVIAAAALLSLSACAGQPSFAQESCALVSWYGPESGSRTANGERFIPDGITAAHRSLPFGTRLLVTDPASGRSVTVRINDRGPAKWTGRDLDLSRGAARAIGIVDRGVARLCFHPV